MSSLLNNLIQKRNRQRSALADTERQMNEAAGLPPSEITNTLIHQITRRIQSQKAALEQTLQHIKVMEAALGKPAAAAPDKSPRSR